VERYRVVGLLGKGGMGEVYRADDLKLGQPVALKFLPEALQDDPERLERFYQEVRIAREVSHPAVCRVHDIGEIEGRPFLSMEYVDGENLSSLLRRIGRLPRDKALDIARQISAGLAAAHAKGVLHRDLKPDNVMLDGRGKARLTDFGLAAAAASIRGEDVRSGTPAYMSPEQISGREVTLKSDLYSLGLVLYELVTGKRVFDGRTLTELARQHEEQEPVRPSALVDDLDPAVERVILHCLEKEPRNRPVSALAVAAVLSGGDVLAAALAVGETPSPEMVAAAGRQGGLSPARAWTSVAVIAACLSVAPFLAQKLLLVHQVPMEKSPAVLEDRAREFLRKLGRDARITDSGSGFSLDRDYLRRVAATDRSKDRWLGLRTGQPPVVRFWYRESPQDMVPVDDTDAVVSWGDPPVAISGMVGIRYDMLGRLLEFYAVPPQKEEPSSVPAPAPDWAPLFTEAGLDRARFRSVEPLWTPPFYCDSRAAWEGSYPDRPDITLRIEAAAYRGQPVAFNTIAPWTRAARMIPYERSAGQRAAQILTITIFIAVILASALLARRHLRQGRGDRRGAVRLAAYAFALGATGWALSAHHLANPPAEMYLLARGLGSSLLVAALIWLFYLAVEPWVRRSWPQTIVSWTRLLGGGFRDPLVGRDLLLGTAAGALLLVIGQASDLAIAATGVPLAAPWVADLDTYLALTRVLAVTVEAQIRNAIASIALLLMLLLLRVILRRLWLAGVVLVLLLSVQNVLLSETPFWVGLAATLPVFLLPALCLMRAGLLGTIVMFWTANLLGTLPLTPRLGHWTAPPTVFAMLLMAALAAYGFRAAQAPGRSTLA
jgi:serine/threonine-protein kinase